MSPTAPSPDVYRSDTGIYRLYRAGILSGYDDQGTFRPNSPHHPGGGCRHPGPYG